MKRKLLFLTLTALFFILFFNFKKTSFALDNYKDLENYNLAYEKVGWKHLGINKGIENEKISLKWNEEQRFFKKGYVAHADSKLLFVLNDTQNTNIYDEFRCYVGNLYTRGDYGDGIKFLIKVGTKIAGKQGTAEDHFSWEVGYDQNKVFKSSTNAEYLKINVKNKDALLLQALKNGNNTNDHATYGFPILCMADYNESIPSYIKTKQEYKITLKQFNFKNGNIIDIRNDLFNYYLVKNVGYYNLVDFGNTSAEHKDFLTYIFSDNELKRQYILGGEPINNTFFESFNILFSLYKKHKADLVDTTKFTNVENVKKDIYAKMMASIALEYGVIVRPKYGKIVGYSDPTTPIIHHSDPIDPIERYEIYKFLRNNNASVEENNKPYLANQFFDELPVEYMRWMFNTEVYNDEIKWLNYQSRKKEKFSGNFSKGGYAFLSYTTADAHDKLIINKKLGLPGDPESEANFQVYATKYELSKFGITNDGKIRYWIPWESGQVCGGISYNGIAILNSAGFPATLIGQPGHGAYLNYFIDNKTNRKRWFIDNNIFGWGQSEKAKRLPLNVRPQKNIKHMKYNVGYILLTQPILDDFENYEKVKLYDILSDIIENKTVLLELRIKALNTQKINYQSWVKYISALKECNLVSNKKALDIFYEFLEIFDYYPMALFDLVALLESSNISQTTLFEIKNNYTKQLNKIKDTPKTNFLYNHPAKEIAKELLGVITPPATFSFSGENSNKIMISSEYQNSTVKYSFDKGLTWTETREHEIVLTEEEISKITTDGILVGFLGTSAQHLINITKSKVADDTAIDSTTKKINKETTNMLWSFDGKNFYDFSKKPIYETNNQIYLKYKNHNTSLESDVRLINYRIIPSIINPSDIDVILEPEAEGISLKDILKGSSGNYISKTKKKGPHTIILELSNLSLLNNVTIYKRSDGLNEAIISEIELEASTDGVVYNKLGKFTNNKLNRPLDIYIPPTPAKFIKISVLKTNDNNAEFNISLSQILLTKIEISKKIFADKTGYIEIERKPLNEDIECIEGHKWFKQDNGIYIPLKSEVVDSIDKLKDIINNSKNISADFNIDLSMFENLRIKELNTTNTKIDNNTIFLKDKIINENKVCKIYLTYIVDGFEYKNVFLINFTPYNAKDEEIVKYYDENGTDVLYNLLNKDNLPNVSNDKFTWYQVDKNKYILLEKETSDKLITLKESLKDKVILKDKKEFLIDKIDGVEVSLDENQGFEIVDNTIKVKDKLNNASATISIKFKKGLIEETITQELSYQIPSSSNAVLIVVISLILVVSILAISITLGIIITKNKRKNILKRR